MKTIKSDLLALKSGILVHGCNCQGVMGGGIAKAIRDIYPVAYTAYTKKNLTSGLQLGDIQVIAHSNWTKSVAAKHIHVFSDSLPEDLFIVNAMTQFNFGRDEHTVYVDYDAIFACFSRIKLLARDSALSVNFPLIGCGLANGDWKKVEPLIEEALGQHVTKNLYVI